MNENINPLNKLADSTSSFLKGESQPMILFEITYLNIAVMAVAVILIIVISKIITNAIGTK